MDVIALTVSFRVRSCKMRQQFAIYFADYEKPVIYID